MVNSSGKYGWEHEIINLFKILLKKSCQIIEIGANIGAHTVRLGQLLKRKE